MSAEAQVVPRLPTRELWGVAALIFGWLALTAGWRSLALPDEGRYVGVAWEMLRSGDWLTPTLDGMPFFHKPPLFYWITAGALKLFGMHEWAARVASVLGATLGAFALYVFLRRWHSQRMARWTVAVLCVQPLFFIGAQFANLDMLVAGCISATILLAADAVLSMAHHEPSRGALVGAYAVAGLGVLAKGLIGLVLPALVIGVWLVISGRWRLLLRLCSLPGAALFLMITAPWFMAEQQRFPDFLHYFFVVQHFQRFAGGGFNNVQPFWFYPALLLLLSLPWLPWLATLLRRQRQRGDAQRDDIGGLMLVWLVCIVGFFSLPQSKLVGYVLPAVPPLAYFIGDSFVFRAPRPRLLFWWRVSLALTVLVSFGTIAYLARHPLKTSQGFADVLNRQRQAGEKVVMLRQYAYDLPFHARLSDPVTIVDDWGSPSVQASDNWRKEIADASQFASPQDRQVLIEPARLLDGLCASPVSWVLGDAAVVRQEWPMLAELPALMSDKGRTLWRIEAKALDCRGTPNVGSADK